MKIPSNIPIITVDGPSGVGKGTLVKMLAKHTGYNQLDSGAIYRLCALYAMSCNLSCDCENTVKIVLKNMDVKFISGEVFLNNKNVTDSIRDEKISSNASKLAKFSSLRDGLYDYMRSFLKKPGLIADGRDMGTVVFPEANLKIFLIASPEERAKRRFNQLKEQGKDVNMEGILSDLIHRDERDKKRTASPLEPAKEAVTVDTSLLTIEDVFLCVIDLMRERHITGVL